MKVSIITVCFNSSATIQNTITSVKNQTYSNIEYVVVDGNSTDGTVDIIKKNLKDIDQFICEPDQGLYDAINKGIRNSTGDIIGILNSDDVFFNDFVVKKIVNFHLANEIDASVGDIVQCSQNGFVLRRYSGRIWRPRLLLYGFMPPHPSIFITKNAYDKLGVYRLDFEIASDYELIVRYFYRNKIKWKYSKIATTKMLRGGVSSSGFSSYKKITKEIVQALKINGIHSYSSFISLRFFFKLLGFFNRVV